MINGCKNLYDAKDFSPRVFQSYLVFIPAKNTLGCTMLMSSIIFGADMSLSVLIYNKSKDILILGERPAHG